MNANQEPSTTPAAAPVGTEARRAAKRPSKPKVTRPAKKIAKGKPKSRAKLHVKGTGPAVLREYVEKGLYKERDKPTAGGNPSIDCGDKVADALRGKPLADVYEHVAKKANVPLSQLKKKYAHLNVGMQRMTLGNILRGAV